MNCLVTKLKATVNNPNLPILKTMQQFTLDAIVASGNESMTDEQKWALNDLFIAMGVDGSNQVMQKIRKLYLPMIAGNVGNALINYATDSFIKDAEPNDANWELRNHGIAQKASGQYFTLTLDDPLVATNFAQMWLRTENMVLGDNDSCMNMVLRGKTNTSSFLGLTELSASNNTIISLGNYGFSGITAIDKYYEQRKVAGISYRSANDISIQLYENYNLITTGDITATTDMSSESSQTLYVLGLAGQQAPKPFGFMLLGEAISDSDFKNIRDKVNALYDAIKA